MFITSDMLTWIRQVLDSSCPDYLKQLMICIAIHLGFHFGYRVGEICISNGDDSHTILNEDVIFETFKGEFINAVDAKNYCISVIAVCIVILRSSKTNQTGGGTPTSLPDILLGRFNYWRIYSHGHKLSLEIPPRYSSTVLLLALRLRVKAITSEVMRSPLSLKRLRLISIWILEDSVPKVYVSVLLLQ